MKKTAMIVALSCVLACPSFVDARQCSASEPWFAFGASKAAAAGMRISSLHVAGRLPMNLSQLEERTPLNHLKLDIMEKTGVTIRSEPFQVRRASHGSACIEFQDIHRSGADLVMNELSGVGGEYPAICISAEGRIDAHFEVTKAAPIEHIRLGVGRTGPDVLFDAVESGCNAACPPGKSTLLIESMTTKPDRSATDGVVALVGMASVGLEQLQASYNLKNSVLEVGSNDPYGQSAPPSRLIFKQLRTREDGAVCMVFEAFPVGRDGFSPIANFVDAKQAEPNVCISKGGWLTGSSTSISRDRCQALCMIPT